MTGRSLFRVLRWVALAGVAPVLWACNARTLEAPKLTPEQTYGKNFAQTINRNIDLLFMIDDSTSMRPVQNNLTRNFPTFMTALRAIPGGLPNVHIAVISSDMGAGDGSIGQCNASGGDNGIFQTTPKGTTCTGGASGLNGSDPFISDVGGVRNYTGNLEDVFSCIAALGDTGCGMEQQFGSITRALGVDGAGAPPLENQNFLRPDAYLGIIMITNEDDCTSGVGPNFYDTSINNSLGSQLGPMQSYRCNEFGHICDGVAPVRLAPTGAATDMVNYTACTSAEGAGYLKTVAETVGQVKSAKTDQSMILVASIQGAPTPYQVRWKAPPTTDTGPWPYVNPACTSMSGDGSYADPGIRLAEFVSAFGANGVQLSICSGEYSAALMRIAELIGQAIQPPCITQKIAMKPGTQEPDCTVVSHTKDSLGKIVDSTVQQCGNGVGAPCWQLVGGGATCAGGQIIDPAMLMDPNASMTASQNATVNCSLCDPMFPDPARGC